MIKRNARKLAVGAAVLVAVAGVGTAVAGTGVLRADRDRQAVLQDAAEQLGVTPNALSSALKQALKNRVDEAVEAGRLTEAQANEVKERIDSNDFPLLGFGRPHMHHRFGPLAAAAEYLGMTHAQLRAALDDGDTLAEVARERDKSVDGLVQALVADAREHLDQAVEDGRLTDAQRDSMVEELDERTRELVNGDLRPPPHFERGFEGRPALPA